MAIQTMEPLGNTKAVRNRLLTSLAVALALGFAWGPFCAFANLIREAPPTVLFSPSRYLFLSTAVSVALAVATILISIPFLGVTILSWTWLGDRMRRWFITMAVVGVGLLAAGQLGIRGMPMSSRVTMLLAWAIISAYFDRRELQLAAFPIACLYVLFSIADIAELYPLLLAAIGLAYAARLYLKRNAPESLTLEAIGMAGFVAIPFAVLVHVRVGHYVPPLDLPYTVALVGLLVMVLAILLIVRAVVTGLRLRWGVLLSICGAVVLAGGAYWAQHPPDPPRLAATASDRPNIILIVWDTTRAQELPAYGYDRRTTRVFDRLASEGALFERAIAPGCWTFPTHSSMFTGMWPRTHAASSGGYYRLAAERNTIAEFLSQAGYETVGISANSAWACRAAGLAQGFQLWLEPGSSAERRAGPLAMFHDYFYHYDAGAMEVERAVRRWLFVRRDPARPFFLFINLMEVHDPYRPRPGLTVMSGGVSAEEAKLWADGSRPVMWVEGPGGPANRQRAWQAIRDLYDGGVRYVDQSTGKILGLLEASSPGESNALTIVTADHGENLGEHDLPFHQYSVYDTLLHVPLVLRWPGHVPAGARVPQTVSNMDVFATIAQAASLPKDVCAGLPSSSLLKFADGAPEGASERLMVAEVWPKPVVNLSAIEESYPYSAPVGRFIAPLFALYDGDWKYIRGAGQNRELLYNIAADPGETEDLSSKEPQRCAQMSAMLDEWLEKTPNNMPTFADGYEKAPLRK